MTVTVKLFAVLRDTAGAGEVSVALREGATVMDAGKAVAERFPGVAVYLAKVAYAVNLAYAPGNTTLREGDEVALIPAVSGGCD